MPTAHTLRRWFWRANAVLALGVVAVWVVALLDRPERRPLPGLPAPPDSCAPRRLGPDVPWQEVVSLGRAFHGWGENQAPSTTVVEKPHEVRLPLAAYKLMMWAHDPGGPDTILLKSKDPAHSELFLPQEGLPDRGVVIEAVVRRGRCVFITVSRGDERFTYEVVDRDVLSAVERRFVRITPRRSPADDRTRLASNARLEDRVDVKVLPFFGRDGQVAGARVTGVRPGSSFARAGLRAGDVIVGVDEEAGSNLDRCRAWLSSEKGTTSLRVRGSADEELRRVVIDS